MRPVPYVLCCTQLLAHLSLHSNPLLLFVQLVDCIHSRHLDPLTLIPLITVMTEGDIVVSCSELMQNTGMCLSQSAPLLNLGESISIQYTKSLSVSIFPNVLEDDL